MGESPFDELNILRDYTKLETSYVPFEESAMGQIHKDLQMQTDEMRKYSATQEINRNHDKAESDRNNRKQLYQNICISVGSAVLGAFLSNIDRIILFFINIQK